MIFSYHENAYKYQTVIYVSIILVFFFHNLHDFVDMHRILARYLNLGHRTKSGYFLNRPTSSQEKPLFHKAPFSQSPLFHKIK